MKRFTFSSVGAPAQPLFQLWTHENGAIELFTPRLAQQQPDYIHHNAGPHCGKPEVYLYSSARNQAGLRGMVEIDFL